MKPTQEQVIAWALKCGASIKTDCNGNGAFGSGVDLNALAALAYEAGQESMKWDGIHSCHPDCQRPACVHTRKAVEAEREACAKVAEERWLDKANCTAEEMYELQKKSIADAIRARREQ